jgi:phytoene/squalene synthetase
MKELHQVNSVLPLPPVETLPKVPILDLGARLWDVERYKAFKGCYSLMRDIDDIADTFKADAENTSEQKALETALRMQQKINNTITSDKDLKKTIATYDIPHWIWDQWQSAMTYDLTHNGFSSFEEFLSYSEGAAVTPGALFILLGSGISLTQERVMSAARPLATFSYLVHILRDLRHDIQEGLHYLADDILTAHNLSKKDLTHEIKKCTFSNAFSNVIKTYIDKTETYKKQAALMLQKNKINNNFHASICVIFSLYDIIFENIKENYRTLQHNTLIPDGTVIMDIIKHEYTKSNNDNTTNP